MIAAHGTKGEVRVKPFTLAPENLGAYGALLTDAGRALTVAGLRSGRPGEIIVQFEGVRDRDAAEALRGRQLSVAREALPPPDEDEFYLADLIGLAVEDTASVSVGRIRALHNFGAGDVMEVETPSGTTEFIPFNDAVVRKVELPTRVVIDPPRYEEA